MAAQAASDMRQYITRTEAQTEIGHLVKEQLEAFTEQRKAIEEQSQAARETMVRLAAEVDNTLQRNKADCEKQIAEQVGELRTQAEICLDRDREDRGDRGPLQGSHVVPRRRRAQADKGCR